MLSTTSHTIRESGPKAREMVADLWSRSGARAAPAQIRAPQTTTGQGMGCPAAAVTAPRPSQAAAPDSECAGPIMVVPTPCSLGSPLSCFAHSWAKRLTAGRQLSVTPDDLPTRSGCPTRLRPHGGDLHHV